MYDRPSANIYGISARQYLNAVNDTRFNPDNILGKFPKCLKWILISIFASIIMGFFSYASAIYCSFYTFKYRTIGNGSFSGAFIESPLYQSLSPDNNGNYVPSDLHSMTSVVIILGALVWITFLITAFIYIIIGSNKKTHKDTLYFKKFNEKLESEKLVKF